MSNTLQEYLASATAQAAGELEAATLRLPEEKRNISPMGNARTPLDLVAECAVLNGTTVEMLETRKFPENWDQASFERLKAELIEDWPRLSALLKENTAKVVEAIRAVPEEELGIQVLLPWGPVKLQDVAGYPYWNMKYHEGQINYLASMLGCLEQPEN